MREGDYLANLTAIILTMNEEADIAICINSIKRLADRIVVVDSGSTDKTVEIAKNHGADVYHNPFVNYATQFNWALDNTGIDTLWVLRIDADERFTPELCEEAAVECDKHVADDINGMRVNQRVFFLNRWLKHGDVYPFQKLLIFKVGIGRIENRNIDEHTILSYGRSILLKHDAEHYAIKNIHGWIHKHNWYATRAAMDYFEQMDAKTATDVVPGTMQTKRKQRVLYYKFPIFLRPFALFLYRYVIKGGFLDGTPGFIYHIMLNFWYRELVDAKIYEHEIMKTEFAKTGPLM